MPRPLVGSGEPHFSFAGLKSAVVRAVGQYSPEDLSASFQQAVVDCLIDRVRIQLAAHPDLEHACRRGRGRCQYRDPHRADRARRPRAGLRFVAPPGWLCTDNAAMIAWAGAERFAAGLTDPLDAPARARWPLDPDAEKVRGAGVRA